MLTPGRACKVSAYLNEDASDQNNFLYEHVLALLREREIEGATVYRPFAGFGPHGQLHSKGSGPVAGEHLPVLVIFIDTEERVMALMPELKAIVTDGLIEMQSVEVIQHLMKDGSVDGR